MMVELGILLVVIGGSIYLAGREARLDARRRAASGNLENRARKVAR